MLDLVGARVSPIRVAFSNMKISTRILAGFVSVLVLVGAMGAAGVLSLAANLGKFRDYGHEAAITTLVLQVENDIGDLDRNARQFVFTGADVNARAATEAKARLEGEIADVSKQLDGERAKIVRQLGESVKSYDEGFRQVVALRKQQQAAIADVLKPAAETLKRQAKALAEHAKKVNELSGQAFAELAEQQLDAMTALIDKYEHEPDVAVSNQVVDAGKKLKSSLDEVVNEVDSAELKTEAGEMAKTYAAYTRGFDELAATTPKIGFQVDQVLASYGQSMAQAAQNIRASAVEAQKSLRASTEADISNSETLMIGLGIACVLIGLALAWAIGRSINLPMRAMIEIMGRLAAGDRSVRIVALKNRDEIGDMARAVEVFKRNAVENDRLQSEQAAAAEQQRKRGEAERLAEAKRREEEARRERENLETRRADEERRHKEDEERERAASEHRRNERRQLAENFEATVKGVVEAVSAAAAEMQSTATSMAATAEETSRQSTTVAAASGQATSNVQAVATATEELSASVGEIGRQVEQSTRIAEKAVTEAGRTNATVKGLSEAAQKIGKVVEMINGIAGQTNLLALNATIEAARAGEAGKGFAVVASEVKSLANQTAKATDEIGAQIAAMQQVTSETVAAIEGIGATIREISEIATAIASAIEEQSAATKDIARNVQQTAAGTEEVSSNISSVTRAAGDTGAAANLVLKSAAELSRQSELLRAEVNKFVSHIRAA
ncbi:MAG TPA: methyl-accepting chemotaxis protein [Candidatus Cybelea sp.]|nr:methyl-accepting chemotaxis protein [Candidatus Cybelea sp.]